MFSYAVISLQPLSVKACLFNFTSRLLILAQPKWMPHFLEKQNNKGNNLLVQQLTDELEKNEPERLRIQIRGTQILQI